jgi:hypothetical protein
MSGVMDELVSFLAARYADEWAAARDRELRAGLDESHGTREVEAKRAILALYVDTAQVVQRAEDQLRLVMSPPAGSVANRDYLDGGRELAVLKVVIRYLGGVYSDHPDYDPSWAS